jgi:glycosyltransferase involved in cell wall biosynthesis
MNLPSQEQTDIKVSVAMITYNHERFIAQAIESVLMQETHFPVELVIGEDCSTDNTRAIVQDYGARYPERIRLLLPENNLGVMPNFIATIKACQGRYVALCEGDDYWTDPCKLQKQIDFLEERSDYSACFHRTYRLIEATGEMEVWRFRTQPLKRFYALDDIIRSGDFIRTGSVIFRHDLAQELPAWFCTLPVGDWPLFILLAQEGWIGFLDEVMSVYRVHDGGIRSGATISLRHQSGLRTIQLVQKHLGSNYEKAIRIKLSFHLLGIATLSANAGDIISAKEYFKKSLWETPIYVDRLILDKLILLVRLYMPSVYRFLKSDLRGKKQK